MIELQDKYKGKSRTELEHIVSDYYRDNFQGKCVVNKELNIEVCFNAIGRKKTSFGGRRSENLMTSKKATAITILDKLIEDAKYFGMGAVKEKHIEKYNAVNFLNFNAYCIISKVKKKAIFLQNDKKRLYKRY